MRGGLPSTTSGPHCTGDFRAKDIRHYKARCVKNPTMLRRIRTELSEHPAVDMPSEK
jgi:hypothetical protein